ncbi:DUF3558 domain-containing protein [Amycolatopsis saalfeldensis]|uniref:DUF3558 domain-containing protein n=1 Tax=Amycolatopsis saalfeldensis TaxID=394193 RepID=UPI000B847E88|nr:DUF3558 domain-containing protein [Amycolatopsis saalfeldensis]
MHSRHLTALLCTTIAAIAVAGCGSTSNGQATPAPSSSAAGDPILAPKVTDPIANTESYASDPCSAVPSSEVESLGGPIKQTKTDNSDSGNLCVWTFTDLHGSASGGLLTKQTSGINGLYIDHQKGYLTTFTPHAPIAGYPAVIYARGGESEGNCNLAVGVRDDLAYTVVMLLRSGPAQSNACGIAEQIATTAVEHMKGK